LKKHLLNSIAGHITECLAKKIDIKWTGEEDDYDHTKDYLS